ncbi:hypothetical protein [Ktedonobacter racemifer]|uniref:Uncharacterized protein n=1 Tax=Ktedonobacter racemifer DSM 44963 TaxID=485913 RepID=D6U8W3_KTERA|nr:hypothetical protein [Ktedonobacter racemifer]EFH79571.1 hypothetical protein Krac_0022 [Ktedonobacter racemifer DSM 44963]
MEMDPSQIKTIGDFRRFVLLLADGIASTTPKSLEEYLRALWNLIQQAQAKPVTYALLGQLLQDAFLVEPLPFHEAWLSYDVPPDLDKDDHEQPFSVLQQMICYQIADLHRMVQAGLLENEWRFYGIDSPTGHRWFNFDPSSYLQCAPQSIQEDGTSTDASWLDLAILLWLGQIYE